MSALHWTQTDLRSQISTPPRSCRGWRNDEHHEAEHDPPGTHSGAPIRRVCRPLCCDADSQTPPQNLPIGIIDFYGLHKLSAAQLQGALTFKVGDRISRGSRPPSIEESMMRLMAIPGVRSAHPDFVCCADGAVIVFIGIDESGAAELKYREPPTGTVRLPAAVIKSEHEFEDDLGPAVLHGHSDEDDSSGESISSDPALRAVQQQFKISARDDRRQLLDVLRHSSDAHHRAVAALVLGYVRDKQAVVNDLVAAVTDPDDEVRNNAVRTLLVFASTVPTATRKVPRVPYEPFIALLNSPVWTDRNKASGALVQLSKSRDPVLFARLRSGSMPALVEMARWKSVAHASAALFILGRMAGYSDEATGKALKAGERERIIADALRTK